MMVRALNLLLCGAAASSGLFVGGAAAFSVSPLSRGGGRAAGPHAATSAPSAALPADRRRASAVVGPLSSTPEDVIEEMDPERRSNLFQTLLRDLQVEGTPVLGCDADQVHTFCAALWTTMAEVSEGDDENKACIVMENIPLDALKAFVQDFTVLKGQPRLMAHLKELSRISVSLVGRGVGPALVIEVAARTEDEKAESDARKAAEAALDEAKCTSALKQFVDRVVVGYEACPYTKTADVAPVGLEKRGINPGAVAYRYSGSSDACAALGTFWNCVCELLSYSEEDMSTAVLSLPGIGPGNGDDARDRFAAVVEIVGRNLCLFRGDAVFGLVHFHPAYDRSEIMPEDKPAYGHLPPRSWLRPMMRMNGNVDEAESLTDGDLELSDYQRRAPHTAINILRTSQINAAAGAKSIVDLDLGDGRVEKASGITLYSRNAIRLAKQGRETLQADVEADMAMQR
uniref:Uncharacterized protein n=1 Tax=Odontella aurita TaxID=265563 RepID=A0A7S4K5D9_9STRA|mmetsp:Transcript_62159/g.183776  ORF Transcript_62159/g.183776 Transcript_62159/m.183776 type:complete len:458 (+) Transcript_62159:15-1388(+)